MIDETIKQLRRKAGLTQEELARRAGTPRAYISQIENGVRFPSEQTAGNILVKGIGLTHSQAQRIIKQWKLQKMGLPRELQPIADMGFVAIPVLCSVPCGDPENIDEDADGYISLPKAEVPNDHRLFAVRAKGLSMVAEDILPGDIIICDRDAEVKSGDMAIVEMESGFTLKRLYFRNGRVRLEPANKGFKPIETSKLQIVGKVIYLIKKC